MDGTRRACLDAEVQQIENSFLKLLETTTRFEVQILSAFMLMIVWFLSLQATALIHKLRRKAHLEISAALRGSS